MRALSHPLSDSPLVSVTSYISSLSSWLSQALPLSTLLCFTLGCDTLEEPYWERCSYTLDSHELSTRSDETLFTIREGTQIAGAWALDTSNLIGDCNQAEFWSGIRSDIIEIKTSSGQVLWVLREGDLSEESDGAEARGDLRGETRGEIENETKREIKIGRWIIGEPLILDFPLSPLTGSPSQSYPVGAMLLRVERATYDELRGVIELYDPEREALVVLGEFKLTRVS